MDDDQTLPDIGGMSDEDFLNYAPDFGDDAPADAEPPSEEPETALEDDEATDATDDDAGTDAPGDTDTPDESDESVVEESAEADEPEEVAETDTDPVTKEAEETDKPAESSDIDYKGEYEKLLKPFKANGKELQVANVDEAIQLMQMGANYNKKMAGLKPNLKVLKLLENNNLLDQEKLGYLIDLDKKDPAAIRKLIKDSGIDPLDIDTQEESEYRPKTYTVDDREIELDAVLDRIQDTPTYRKTINLVRTEFDDASKQTVAENPQLLEVLNTHMQTGIYERISSEVERQRMFGRLTGLTDLQAYQQVGDALNAQGAFDGLVQPGQKPPQEKTVIKQPAPTDPKLKDKKRAASSTRTAPKKSGPSADFNPLALSDEEFERAINEKLM